MQHYNDGANESLALGLGWFSLALGVAELIAPHSVARVIGVPSDSTNVSVLRAYGAREFSNGLAILAQPDRSAWLWSRVAGDAVDLATLMSAMNSPRTDRGRAMMATATVLGVAALDFWCAGRLSQHEANVRQATTPAELAADEGRSRTTRIAESVTINQSLERVEERWGHLETLPMSLRNLTEKVEAMRAVVQFRPAPGARGTEVHVELEYEPATGALRNSIGKLFGQDPASQIREDLRRFKQIMETGEVPLSDGPSLRRPAQPAADPRQLRTTEGAGV